MSDSRVAHRDDDARWDRALDASEWTTRYCECGALLRIPKWGIGVEWQCEACADADVKA